MVRAWDFWSQDSALSWIKLWKADNGAILNAADWGDSKNQNRCGCLRQ